MFSGARRFTRVVVSFAYSSEGYKKCLLKLLVGDDDQYSHTTSMISDGRVTWERVSQKFISCDIKFSRDNFRISSIFVSILERNMSLIEEYF